MPPRGGKITIFISHRNVNKRRSFAAIRTNIATSIFFDAALLQKCHARQASWGKLENRFGRIPGTLVSESPYLYLNKQLLERMRRT
jgi:hypothetical protein